MCALTLTLIIMCTLLAPVQFHNAQTNVNQQIFNNLHFRYVVIGFTTQLKTLADLLACAVYHLCPDRTHQPIETFTKPHTKG